RPCYRGFAVRGGAAPSVPRAAWMPGVTGRPHANGVTLMGLFRGASIALIATSVVVSGCSVPRLPRLLGGGAEAAPTVTSQPSVSVNGHLWRASLDTLSYLPLITADPFGGVINYDWYTDARAPNERFKATVFILDARLRADALNVSIVK